MEMKYNTISLYKIALLIAPFSSPIQTVTVGFGISPNQSFRMKGVADCNRR